MILFFDKESLQKCYYRPKYPLNKFSRAIHGKKIPQASTVTYANDRVDHCRGDTSGSERRSPAVAARSAPRSGALGEPPRGRSDETDCTTDLHRAYLCY